jgi:hypothetical protein
MPTVMSDEHTAVLQEIAGPDWKLWDSATHYHEMARQLREMADASRLPDPREELLTLAQRFELRAESLRAKYLRRNPQPGASRP